jgi:hypothetical protein
LRRSPTKLATCAAQPNAVRTVIAAGRAPVTQARLLADLGALTPALLGEGGGSPSLWAGFQREVSELFILRPASAPSPRASAQIDQLAQLVAAGDTARAADLAASLPGADQASAWIAAARRHAAARQALDLIETGAIGTLQSPAAPTPARAAPPPGTI